MTVERIAPREPPYSDQVAQELAKLMPKGMDPIRIFRVIAHNPRVLGRIRRGGLLDAGAISLRERELVILRVTALCGAEYEWGVHVAFFASAAGFSPEQIAATVSGAREPWQDGERILLDMCRELHESAHVSDRLWAELYGQYQPDQLIELLALAGQYRTVSYLVNGLGIALEPAAPRFPVAPG